MNNFIVVDNVKKNPDGRYRPRVTPPLATMPAAVCLGDPDEDSINVDEEDSDSIEWPNEQIGEDRKKVESDRYLLQSLNITE